MKQVIATTKAPAAIGAYSQGIQLNGLVFTSGQLPVDPATGTMPEDIRDQARQSMENVKAILEEAGLTLADVVKTTIFLNDIADFAAVNEVYQSYFDGAYPARSCFEVAAIPKNAGLEIEVIAGR